MGFEYGEKLKEKILKILSNEEELMTRDLRRKCSVSMPTLRYYLRELEIEGKVLCRKFGNSKVWSLKS